MTIRARLTIWYTAVLTFFIGLFGIAVFSALDLTLRSEVERTLTDTVQGVWEAIEIQTDDERGVVVRIPELDVFRASQVLVQVRDNTGALVDQSENLSTFTNALDPSTLDTNENIWTDINLGMPMRVLTAPLEISGQRVGVIQAAADLRPIDLAKSRLARILLSVGVIAVVVSLVLGALLADRVLKPINAITQVAQNIITADDLSRRIPYHGPPDELGRLTHTINNTLARLEKLFNAQRRFVADVSHELRTPLTTIQGNMDLLRRMPNDQTSMDAIYAEVRRMARLVRDLLLLAQADTGRLTLEKEPLILNDLLIEAYEQARILSIERDIEVALLHDEPVRIEADPDRLMQLIMNLTSNAIKYTPDGGRVTIALTAYNAWARILISDTGVGIPEEDLPYIFDRFYRVDRARTRKQGGIGLGLSIARWIAEAHGGRVTVESQVDHGTTFTIWLPAPDITDEDDTEVVKAIQPHITVARRGRQTVIEEH